jgi:hypothetical protein
MLHGERAIRVVLLVFDVLAAERVMCDRGLEGVVAKPRPIRTGQESAAGSRRRTGRPFASPRSARASDAAAVE